jgi:hypothetical protein
MKDPTSKFLDIYLPLTPQQLRDTLAWMYQNNPQFKAKLHQLNAKQIDFYVKQMVRSIEESYYLISLSSSQSRRAFHKRHLRAFLEKDCQEAKRLWVAKRPSFQPSQPWNPTQRSLFLIHAETQQRYQSIKKRIETFQSDLKKLEENDFESKHVLQKKMDIILQELQSHHRYILESYLGHWGEQSQKEFSEKTKYLTQKKDLSPQDLALLLPYLEQLNEHTLDLVDHLAEIPHQDMPLGGEAFETSSEKADLEEAIQETKEDLSDLLAFFSQHKEDLKSMLCYLHGLKFFKASLRKLTWDEKALKQTIRSRLQSLQATMPHALSSRLILAEMLVPLESSSMHLETLLSCLSVLKEALENTLKESNAGEETLKELSIEIPKETLELEGILSEES